MTDKTKFANPVNAYNISVTGRHVQVTEAMKDYAIEKLSKLERLGDRIIDVVVTMDIQRANHKVDIQMKVNNLLIKSSAVTDQMYVSIDQAVHKLGTQLKKYKGRIHEHNARSVNTEEMPVSVVRSMETDERLVNEEIEEENRRHMEEAFQPHQVVDRETKPLKTLSTKEAVMKMDLSGDKFLIYRDEIDQRLKVIYRRNDDNYGIIEPEAAFRS